MLLLLLVVVLVVVMVLLIIFSPQSPLFEPPGHVARVLTHGTSPSTATAQKGIGFVDEEHQTFPAIDMEGPQALNPHR